jgi:hypothetical protein
MKYIFYVAWNSLQLMTTQRIWYALVLFLFIYRITRYEKKMKIHVMQEYDDSVIHKSLFCDNTSV